jgi:beta-glucosidase/6-phospho-beta-glucosidase/beta-galactosidase
MFWPTYSISFSGKGVNIWDTFSHESPWIVDSSTGDIAADSYHLYRQDVEALVQLGVSNNLIWQESLLRS